MYAVILAGGGGTRLWPLSRSAKPKPFLPLTGERTLLQTTVDRLQPLVAPADVHLVTDERYLGLVAEQLPDMPRGNVLGEPSGRNTAAAVAYALLAIERPPDDVMVVLPADHRIADEDGFRNALAIAGREAAGGSFITLGIQPTGPETGYGYVVARERDESGTRLGTAHPVARFVEKPARDRAAELLAVGGAFWNAGIFVWRRDAALAGLERHAPEIVTPIRRALERGDLREAYATVRATSIDYALLEPAAEDGRVAVVPVDVGWSDLGSWSALLDALAAGAAGSVRQVADGADALDEGSGQTLVHAAGGRLVVTVGLHGTIVVDTPDAVLVCDREHAQDVKQIVDRLIEAKETEYL